MACYHPLTAYKYLNGVNENGKSIIRFSVPAGSTFLDWEEVKLPCGQCIGCRLERSRQWALRCCHEALMHEKNCFITLTYSDEYFEKTPRMSGSLKFCKRDFVLFMKRLRKKFAPIRIRFLHCGEYGSRWQRPHHHAILFGVDFSDDRQLKEITKLGFPLYVSKTLDDLWYDDERGMQIGFCRIGECTFDSIAYVARYVIKKINGEDSYDHYYGREPEYITMSRRPGIGYDWLLANPQIYNYDEIIMNGLKLKPPHYYDRKFEEIAPEFMENIKLRRRCIARAKQESFERLLDKEEIKLISAKRLVRSYESDN